MAFLIVLGLILGWCSAAVALTAAFGEKIWELNYNNPAGPFPYLGTVFFPLGLVASLCSLSVQKCIKHRDLRALEKKRQKEIEELEHKTQMKALKAAYKEIGELIIEAWRSLVAHLSGGQGVAGSNPAVSTALE